MRHPALYCFTFTAKMSRIELGTIQSIILSAEPRVLRRMEVEINTSQDSHAHFMVLTEGRIAQLAERGMLAVVFL